MIAKMKKVLCMLLLIFLVLNSFAGCSLNKKSQSELREDKKKELQAERVPDGDQESTGQSAQNDNSKEYANNAKGGKLSRFPDEDINGVQVNYSDNYSVIIPMYYGANISALESVSKMIGSPTSSYQTMKLNFAVFGELKDVVITYFAGMDSEGIPTEMGTLTNVNVNLEVYASNTDMTYLKVTGKAYIGEGDYRDVKFTLDDMRDSTNYKVIMFK